MKVFKLLSHMALAIMLATTAVASLQAAAGSTGRVSMRTGTIIAVTTVATGVIAYRLFNGRWPFERRESMPDVPSSMQPALQPRPVELVVAPQPVGGLGPQAVVVHYHHHRHDHANARYDADALAPAAGNAEGHVALALRDGDYRGALAGALVPHDARGVVAVRSAQRGVMDDVSSRAFRGLLLLIGYELLKKGRAKWYDSNLLSPPLMELWYEGVCYMIVGVVLVGASVLWGVRG